MTEEIKPTENNTTPEPTQADESGGKSKDWEKIAKDAQRRADAVKQKLADFEKAQAEAAEQKHRQELEAKGQYEQLLKEKEDEFNRLIQAREFEILKRDLRDQLRSQAKSADDIFLEWAVDHFGGPAESLQEYIDSLKESEKTARYFEEPQSTPQSGHMPPAAASVKGAGKTGLTIEQIKAYENSGDREQRKIARDYLKTYRQDHGKYPY